MDPLSAIGLAANILQFINFGVKVVSKGNQIYRSGDGTLQEDQDLALVTNDLLLLQTKLSEHLRPQDACGCLNDDDQALESLAVASNELAKELLQRLDRAKAHGRHLRWKSLRQALKSVCEKKDVDDMARRMTMLRDELNTRILVSLRDKTEALIMQQPQICEDLDHARKQIISSIENRVDNLIREHTDLLARRQDQSDALLVDTAESIKASFEPSCQETSKLGDELWAGASEIAEGIIIKSLAYPSMAMREDAIAEAHARTFEWIFQPTDSRPWDDFISWLGDSRDGAGIYWINGKAASGKSTLMKFLTHDKRIENTVRQWAGTMHYMHAKFFFYNLGTHVQKSQAGLLLSLLHQSLARFPRLTKEVFPKPWQDITAEVASGSASYKREFSKESCSKYSCQVSWDSWSLSSLKSAFHNLMEQEIQPLKHCYFIDGLDEFEGDHTEIATFFQAMANYKNVKICLSSRPLMVFEQDFRTCPQLRLQDLTRDDITLYVRDKFNTHTRAIEMAGEEPQLVYQLIEEIVQTSSGVFLWVSLVVKSLLTGMSNYDRTSDLQRRLRALPPELDGLYSHMINNIQPAFYIEQASRLFQLLYHSVGPMSTLALSFADDEEPNACFQPSLGLEDRQKRVRSISGRVKSRCAGLLEVKSGYPLFADFFGEDYSEVRYMHLTVKEFLEKPKVWTQLTNRTSTTNFNVAVSLLKASIVELDPNNPRYSGLDDRGQQLDYIHFVIDHAMSYALQAENSTGAAQTSLLDRLRRCVEGTWFKDRFRPNSFHNPHVLWVNSKESPIPDNTKYYHDSFLSFAVARGLTRYAQLKIGHQAHLVNRDAILPMLEYATTYGPEFRFGISSQPPMVAMLLKAGMNPNEWREDGSPWQKVLNRLCESSAKEPLDSAWLDICKMFAMHGAARNASCTHEHNIDIVELVQTAFPHLPQDSVQELLDMLKPPRSKWEAKRKGRKNRKRKQAPSASPRASAQKNQRRNENTHQLFPQLIKYQRIYQLT